MVDYENFLKEEAFKELDANGDNYLSIWEVSKKYRQENVLQEFAKAINKTSSDQKSQDIFSLDSDRYRTLPTGTVIGFSLEKMVGDEWLELGMDFSGERVSVTTVKARFEGLEKEEQEKKKLKNRKKVSGPGLTANRGLVLLGERIYDEASKSIYIDRTKQSLTLRIIKEFTSAGTEALPAMFSVLKNKGSAPIFGVDGAIRLDYYEPRLANYTDMSFRPAVGAQWNRSGTGKKKRNIQRYYLNVDWFWNHPGDILRSSQFQIGPLYERDSVKNIDKITGLVEWEPYLNLPLLPSTGIRHSLFMDKSLFGDGSLFGDDPSSFFVRPRLALELNEVLDQTEPQGMSKKVPNNTFFRYGMEAGFTLLKGRLNINYKMFHRIAADDSRREFIFHDATLNWSIDEEGHYTLTAGYKNGRTSPDFIHLDQFTAGFGLKF